MKYKEAINKLINNTDLVKMFDIEKLYQAEFLSRIELRSHGNTSITETLAFSVLYEMDEWIVKVCRGLGWGDDACEKAKMECRSTAIASMKLTSRKEGKPVEITSESEAHKKLITYALLGHYYEQMFKDK